MTITFENDNDVIVYALEKVISYAKRTQQIFVAQVVWWLASVIGIERGLISYIDTIQSRVETTVNSGRVPEELAIAVTKSVSPQPRDIQEETRRDRVLWDCEEFLREPRRSRDIAALKSKGTTCSGRINPTPISKKALKKRDRHRRKELAVIEKPSLVEGINETEIQRRRASDECLRCAWPSDRKGSHYVKNCSRHIKLDKGTANFPKKGSYRNIEQECVQLSEEEVNSRTTDSEESSDDLL